MKQIILISLTLALLLSCNDTKTHNGNGDLESLRSQLKEKQEAFNQLSLEIDEIQSKITELDTSEKVRRLVTVDTIRKDDFKHFVDIQASIESDQVVHVSSEVPGRILRVYVQEGQSVNRGQLIAKIEMESTEKQLDELKKSLEFATSIYERQSKLWEQNIGSEIQYLEAKNNKERIEKSIASVNTQLTKSNIHSPISGVVETLSTKEGEFASPGMPIAKVVNLSKLKVTAEVPEKYVGKIKMRENVILSFPSIGEEVEGRVTMIGRTISTANRTFKVEANILSGNTLFKPNMLALMKVSDYEEKDAISIPLDIAQQEASGKFFVLVKKDNEQGSYASKKYVTLGKTYDNQTLVEEGLEVGDIVIIKGARGLANNELIEIYTEAPTGDPTDNKKLENANNLPVN